MFNCGLVLLAVSVLILLSAGVTAVPLERFYLFGENATNDEYLAPADDDMSAEVKLGVGYIFFGQHYESIYVSKE